MKTKILLLDDDLSILSLYGKILRDEGYEVYLCPNAKLAVEHLVLLDIDIVLLDLNMPDFGGEMMFGVIRGDNPHLKIIIASVYPIAKQKKWVHGATNYFDKAQGVSALLKIVRETLGQTPEKQIA